MKKLIFLLIVAVILAGIMPAQDAAKPWGNTQGIVMFGGAVDYYVVIPDTVLSLEYVSIVLQDNFLVMLDYNSVETSGQPHNYYLIKPIDGQCSQGRTYEEPQYWLRL